MDLDFKNDNTAYSTHGFHTYPAKMIPQVAFALLEEYGSDAKTLFDPYCGSGTSLVEANQKGINAIGTDLNPLARLIAKVKTTSIELQTLDLHLKDFYDYLFNYRFGFRTNEDSIVAPKFHNIDFWFSRSVKKDLSIILSYLKNIENDDIKNFFKVAFSQTIRACSWTRNNEFKLYKMSAERIKTFKPDTFATFEKVLGKNRKGLEEFMSKTPENVTSSVENLNSSDYISPKIIPDNSIDVVVTSPPYGDSKTTVAYGQFSALANQWLNYMERGRALDNQLMGGKKEQTICKFESDILNKQIQEINLNDKSRALDVSAFYKDYFDSIQNITKKIKSGGKVCYVVSNRIVRGTQLQTHQITKDFFEYQEFKHINTFERLISNKRLPRKNSSIGVKGKTTPLMNKEYIIVMQKP